MFMPSRASHFGAKKMNVKPNFNKPLQGMAPTPLPQNECPVTSKFLLAFVLLACLLLACSHF